MFTTGMRHVLLPAVAVLLLAGTARAAVQYLGREHSVFARANQVSDEEMVTSAPVATLRAEADGSNAEFRSTALATQDVEVGDGGFLFAGRLEFEVTTLMPPSGSTAGLGAAAGFGDGLTFVLTEPHDYRFIQRQNAEQISGSQEGEQAFNLVGPGGEVFSTNNGPREGRLEPGEYEFSYGREVTNSVVNGPENGVFRATYEVGLTLTPGGANPIPLPAGVWPGIITMAGVGTGMWLRHRRRLSRR